MRRCRSSTISDFRRIAILAILFISGCRQPSQELLTLEEATQNIPIAIYAVDNSLGENDIETRYRYYDGGSELSVLTVFLMREVEGATERIGYLRTCNVCEPIGIGAAGWFEEQVTLPEPFFGEADTCPIVSDTYNSELISGPDYVTCLLWWREDPNGRYQLYTIWELEETLIFLERLYLVEREPEKGLRHFQSEGGTS